jgi:hypothetical protein
MMHQHAKSEFFKVRTRAIIPSIYPTTRRLVMRLWPYSAILPETSFAKYRRSLGISKSSTQRDDVFSN